MPDSESIKDRIGALMRDGAAESVQALVEIVESACDKETRKAARRALYLLGQRGVAPVTRGSAPAERPLLARKNRDDKAYLSAVDGAGNRMFLFILAGSEGGTPTLAQLLTNDEEGVVEEPGLMKAPRRQLDEFLAKALEQAASGIAIAEVDFDYARWLLDRARSLNRNLGRRTPRGFLDLWTRIGEPLAEYAGSPVWDIVDADELKTDPTVPRSPDDFFALPWFEPWYLDAEAVAPWFVRRGESQESPIEIPASVKRDRMEQVDAAALDALMPAQLQKLYVGRLEDSADILHRIGCVVPARQALAQAMELSAAPRSADSRFARALLERSLDVVAEMVKASDADRSAEGSPIPAQTAIR